MSTGKSSADEITQQEGGTMTQLTANGKKIQIFPAGMNNYFQVWIEGQGKVATRATWYKVQQLIRNN